MTTIQFGNGLLGLRQVLYSENGQFKNIRCICNLAKDNFPSAFVPNVALAPQSGFLPHFLSFRHDTRVNSDPFSTMATFSSYSKHPFFRFILLPFKTTSPVSKKTLLRCSVYSGSCFPPLFLSIFVDKPNRLSIFPKIVALFVSLSKQYSKSFSSIKLLRAYAVDVGPVILERSTTSRICASIAAAVYVC